MKTAQIYKDTTGEWRFRMRAANNETIAVSEGYKNLQDCEDTARQLGADHIDMADQ